MLVRISVAVLLGASALTAAAAPPSPGPATLQRTSLVQLEQAISASQGKPDADLALQLAGFELTERLSTDSLTRLSTTLPGEKSRQSLRLLADHSAFLDPPQTEIVPDAVPDPAATRQMLVKMVNYVNTTMRRLPNFLATRNTTGYADRPQEDVLGATGITTYSYQPLHEVGRSSATVTYRDHKEFLEGSGDKSAKHGSQAAGLVTAGEFGPILSTVLADALKGQITWARWEKGAAANVAVFHYAVPGDKSNYRVQFCCVVDGYAADGNPIQRVFDEKASYHGEIAFDPNTGAILRITMEAEMPPKGLVPNAAMMVEYAAVDIGGKSYICPVKSISLLLAHTAQQKSAQSRSNYQGPAKTFLNEVSFVSYRRFGTEIRLIPSDANAQ